MQITRETDYAVRCVWYLIKEQNRVKMINEIAAKMSIPKSFLAKILQKLTRANIVKSYRGNKGGFQLVQRPENISIYDVVKAIEGAIAINKCAIDKGLCEMDACEIHPVWIEVRKEVEGVLKNKNFTQIELLKTSG